MKIDKWYHLYGRKNDIVFEEVECPRNERGTTMIIPANDNSNFNRVLADALEREKMTANKTTTDTSTEIMRLVGQYLIDHAEELYPVEYSDLYGDDIRMRIMRRKDVNHDN